MGSEDYAANLLIAAGAEGAEKLRRLLDGVGGDIQLYRECLHPAAGLRLEVVSQFGFCTGGLRPPGPRSSSAATANCDTTRLDDPLYDASRLHYTERFILTNCDE